jgi:lysyl-tRNA synthetase class 2
VTDKRSNWQPTATKKVLIKRARILKKIRAFFDQRQLMEVETPILSQAALTDPHLDSIRCTTGEIMKEKKYLHTSPEFPMKRLLATNMGAIYQICKVFRDGERGKLHNPEFTMLEWYQPGYSYKQLIDEVDELFIHIVGEYQKLNKTEHITYQQAFKKYANLDPYTASIVELKNCANKSGIHIDCELTRNEWLDIILTHQVEPNLGQGRATFLIDYPADQAALARLKPDNPNVAERFELYFKGVELANGFGELVDPKEQSQRFAVENHQRNQLNKPEMPIDKNFLEALKSGMPASSGVAVGVDRLVMVALGRESLQEVIAFPFERS